MHYFNKMLTTYTAYTGDNDKGAHRIIFRDGGTT